VASLSPSARSHAPLVASCRRDEAGQGLGDEAQNNVPTPKRKASLEGAPAEVVEDDQSFHARVLGMCRALQPDESFTLDGLSRMRKTICKEVVQELGLWSKNSGASVLVLREGSIAKRLREEIKALALGAQLRLPGELLGSGLLQFGCCQAELLQLSVTAWKARPQDVCKSFQLTE